MQMQVFNSLIDVVLILITCPMGAWPFSHTISFTKTEDTGGRLGS